MPVAVENPSLVDIVGLNLRALIIRMGSNPDWIIGLVGERGSGKSMGAGNISLRDYGFSGKPLWSNMGIKLTIDVADEYALPFGLPGGKVTFASEFIDRQEFLSLSDRYTGGCIVLDEINIEYGEAYRATSNVNLKTDTAVQQLRKARSGLVWTAINEMYADVRIRDNTDVLIKCHDIALEPGNLAQNMQQGCLFEYEVFAMSSRLVGIGHTFNETHKSACKFRLALRDWWGFINTDEKQKRTGKYTETHEALPIQMTETPVVKAEKARWQWLDEAIDRFYKNHEADGKVITIGWKDLANELSIPEQAFGSYSLVLSRKIKGITNPERGTWCIPQRMLVGAMEF